MNGALTGARPLLKVSLRQDAHNFAPWVMLISVLSATSILGYRWVFPDEPDRVALATAVGANPALELIFGQARDLLTNDGFNAWRAGGLGAFFAGLMAILIVVRNSRADEDSGRAELIASGVITRRARLAVAVGIAGVASVLLFVVCFLLTWASGGDVVPTLLLSATFSASALMFAGVGAVAAQLGGDARTASTIAIAVLGGAYVLRGYLGMSGAGDWTEWLTPFGWLALTRPSTDNDPLPLLAALALTAVLLAVAMVLQDRRDLGLGIVAQRPGRASAPRLTVDNLTLRLHRTPLIVWLLALGFLGSVWGSLVSSVDEVIGENPAMAKFIAAGALDVEQLSFAFVVTILNLIGILAAIVGAQVIMRVYVEEMEDRVEPLLAGAVTRWRFLAGPVAVALGVSALATVVAGTGLGLVASAGDGGIAVTDVLLQALVSVPAVWLMVAVSVAAVGARPAARMAGWAVIVATFGITLLGPTFDFPDWAMAVSPLYHVPNVVADDPGWGSLWGLGAVLMVLLAIGFAGFRRRDVQ
ncbi:ABC transporter permease [Tessaracoccus sp. MC1756]|uniref:ABC transporter permease n=1 Tax=Tessaracoccus sp. MC1756 TaxID=2760311 RepID=UPI0016005DFC|nr:multidrug ABC transporter permease [Tessaracoccus sp. MC1756]MBB1510094.1 multidrug ABC transporter permease [Tessaracoccus sp. MC1756]